ncbi:MAG: hypothetical protein ASARMPREDX12_001997 [Alectoria sarmentosa]|nr:MAG: hypothetical protein ASARMPREDX12_001997 [Alectoria sarmentosa]
MAKIRTSSDDKDSHTVTQNATTSSIGSDTNKEGDGDGEDSISGDAAAAGGWAMDTSDFPGPKSLFWIMIALLISMFIQNLDSTIIATAIPSITDEFHSVDQVGWYASACFLTFASFQSTWGKAFKYFPIKATFLVSLFIFELGSLIIAVAPTSTTLIIGRAIAGAGAAGVSSGVFTIIAFSAPPAKAPAYMGVTGATYAIAAFVGPLLGGVFAQKATWRWCFWINLPIGAVAAIVVSLSYKPPKAATPQPATWKETLLQMDLVGTFLIMAAVVCYLLALQWGGSTKAWSNSSVIVTMVCFVLLLIAFVANELWIGDRALLQPRILKIRRVWTTNAYVFFVSGGFFSLIYYLPIYFQSIQGVDPLTSGVHNLPIIIGCLLCVASGFLVVSFGHWVPLMAVGAAMGTIGCGLCYTLDINSRSSHWIGYQALAGIGIGLGIQIPMMACQAAVGIMDISSVSAITLFFQIIGGSFATSAAQAAFGNTLVKQLPITAPNVNPDAVLAAGATRLRTSFPPEQIQGILEAYMSGIKVVFALSTGFVGMSFLFSLMPRWEKLKPSPKKDAGGAA